MVNKKKEFTKKTLSSDFENLKMESKWNEFDCIIALLLVWGLFGDWGSKSKTEELEKRIAKLETKNEIIEKVLF